MLSDYLLSCWLNPKEIEIFLKIFQYGPKTATQLSHITNIERTNCYKIIQKLSKEWLIQTSEKNGVKLFWVEKTDSIKTYLENKKRWLEKLSNNYDAIEFEFQRLRSKSESSLPKIRLFEHINWLESLYESAIKSITLQWNKVVQMYATDTLESSGVSNEKSLQLAQEFYSQLANQWVTIEQRKGNGISLIEQIQYSHIYWDLASISHWSGSTQIWIIWSTLYIIMFKDVVVGIRIESKELSYMIYALLTKS